MGKLNKIIEIDVASFKKNPVIVYNHDVSSSIGKVEVKDKKLIIKLQDKKFYKYIKEVGLKLDLGYVENNDGTFELLYLSL